MNVVTRVTVGLFGGAFGCFRPPVAPASGLVGETKHNADCVSTTDLHNFLIMRLFLVFFLMYSIDMIDSSFKRGLSLWLKLSLIS